MIKVRVGTAFLAVGIAIGAATVNAVEANLPALAGNIVMLLAILVVLKPEAIP